MKWFLGVLCALYLVVSVAIGGQFGSASTIKAAAVRTATDTTAAYKIGPCEAFTLQTNVTYADLILTTSFIPSVQMSVDGSNWTTVATLDTINRLGVYQATLKRGDRYNTTASITVVPQSTNALTAAYTEVTWGEWVRFIYTVVGAPDSTNYSTSLWRTCDAYPYP